MSGLRVLHLIGGMGVGGAESLVAELVRRGRERGWTCAVAGSGGVRADELATEGVALFDVPAASGVLRAAPAARRAVRAFRPDVVLAHDMRATAVARIAAGGRVPVVTVFHGVAPEDYPQAARLLGRGSGAVVAVSDAVAARLRDAGLEHPEPRVIRNAVTARPAATRAAARRELVIATATPVALCLARLVPQKRHDVLIDAWAMFLRTLPGASTAGGRPGASTAGGRAPGRKALLLLAGDGPLRADLERRVGELGINDSVRFLGNRDNVPDLLAAADVTVLTSDWEGLPVSVLESLASGTPVVASRVDGVAEVLAGGGGLLTPPGHPAAVAEALGTLLTDRTARSAAAAAALRTVEQNHDPAVMVARYEDLLVHHRPAPRPLVGRRTVTALLTALAVVLVGGAAYGAVAVAGPQYQGRIGLVAGPVTPDDDRDSGAQFGEVVQLGMPAVAELVRTPTVLAGAVDAVPGTDPDALADAISVEYVPDTGVARIAVRAGSPDDADRLAVAVAEGVARADVLEPVATLRLLDGRADVDQVSPDGPLALGLALLAAAVAAVAVLALRHLTVGPP